MTVVPLPGPRHAAHRQARVVELATALLTLVVALVRRPAKRTLRQISTGSMTTGIFVVGLAALAGRPDVALGVGVGIAVFVLVAAVLAPQEV